MLYCVCPAGGTRSLFLSRCREPLGGSAPARHPALCGPTTPGEERDLDNGGRLTHVQFLKVIRNRPPSNVRTWLLARSKARTAAWAGPPFLAVVRADCASESE